MRNISSWSIRNPVPTILLFVVLTLYPLCRWVAAVKARRRDWWLSYV